MRSEYDDLMGSQSVNSEGGYDFKGCGDDCCINNYPDPYLKVNAMCHKVECHETTKFYQGGVG